MQKKKTENYTLVFVLRFRKISELSISKSETFLGKLLYR